MRVAILLTEFPSISETFILNQITGLIARGHTVDIYAERAGERSVLHPEVERYALLARAFYEDLPPRRFRRLLESLKLFEGLKLLDPRGRESFPVRLRALNIFRHGIEAASLRLLYAARPFLDAPPYDILHCHFGVNGLKGARLRDIGAARGKLVTTFHGYDLSRYTQEHGRNVYQTLFRRGDLFLPVSEHWRRKLIELGCPPAKVETHRMGVSLERFPFRPPHAHVDGRIVFITVARMVAKKGLEYGVHAVAQLAREGRSVEYRIVGGGVLLEKLRRLIDELEAGAFVKLLGWRSQTEIRELLGASDIYIAPSATSDDGDAEGIPVSLMEAMATGLPVVATRHSGIPELIEDGVTGFLVPERDAAALAGRLRHLLDHQPLWQELARRARATIEREYDNEKLNDELVERYRRALGGAD